MVADNEESHHWVAPVVGWYRRNLEACFFGEGFCCVLCLSLLLFALYLAVEIRDVLKHDFFFFCVSTPIARVRVPAAGLWPHTLRSSLFCTLLVRSTPPCLQPRPKKTLKRHIPVEVSGII